MSATIQGVPELIARLKGISDNGNRMAGAVVSSVADMIVTDAKQSAPADLGKIRQNISQQTDNSNQRTLATIYASAPESAYQEFGTGGKVDVPEDMADIASQFQGGSGGSMAEFIIALTDWVKRHGLTGVYSVKTHRKNSSLSNSHADTQAAWAIAKTILRDGLQPQPFLYPAFVKNSVKLVPMLETALKQLLYQ